MKKIIAACSLLLASGGVFAQDSFYGAFAVGNPDLHGREFPVSDPIPSIGPVTASLNAFQRGNPDLYDGTIEGYTPYFSLSGPTITSYDVFMQGNPDLGYSVDMSLPVVGSAEARAIAAKNCRQRSRGFC